MELPCPHLPHVHRVLLCSKCTSSWGETLKFDTSVPKSQEATPIREFELEFDLDDTGVFGPVGSSPIHPGDSPVLSSPLSQEERGWSPPHRDDLPPVPAISSGVPASFAPKLVRIFSPLAVPQDAFHCVLCGPSTLVRGGKAVKAKCNHYVSCSECRSRVVRQLLRCAACCRELCEGEYPVCNEECEVITKNIAQVLQTGQCLRCNDKLAKDTCSRTCNRLKSDTYKRCVRQLNKEVAAMVLRPEHCDQHMTGSRPCLHPI